ncbi:MAG: CvpA family protein [Burkholderiales bacterium]|nr:CvpA family protein [Burkholderiales bacterium]
MTVFDWSVIGVVALSMLFAYARGFTRELIALLAWVLGFFVAIAFSPIVGAWLPEFGASPVVRYLVAFVLILIAALAVGALVAWPLRSVIRRSGLGFVDRFLGALFGVARGAVLVLAFVLIAGLTSLPRQVWWQNAALAPPLVLVAMSLAPWLPQDWVERLDYSREGRKFPRVERKA